MWNHVQVHEHLTGTYGNALIAYIGGFIQKMVPVL
jgi:hypothetical protein